MASRTLNTRLVDWTRRLSGFTSSRKRWSPVPCGLNLRVNSPFALVRATRMVVQPPPLIRYFWRRRLTPRAAGLVRPEMTRNRPETRTLGSLGTKTCVKLRLTDGHRDGGRSRRGGGGGGAGGAGGTGRT